MSDSNEDDSTLYTSEETKSTMEGEFSIDVMGIVFFQKAIEGSTPIATKIDPPPKEEEEEMISKMIFPTLPPKEHKEFKEMLMGFSNLFMRNHIDMIGVDFS